MGRKLSSKELVLKADIERDLIDHGYQTHPNTTFGWKERYKKIMKELGMERNDSQGAAE